MTTLPSGDPDSLREWALRHDLSEIDYVESALTAYRQDLTALLQQAADGRREYAVNAPESSALILEDEARQLDAVARLVAGDMSVMTAWLPSWRWTPEMCADLQRRD